MAVTPANMRIGVVEIGQSKVSRHIKKSAAESLLRNLVAERISKTVIRMLPVKSSSLTSQYLAETQYHFDGSVPDTNDRFDWSEPILAKYPVANQTSYRFA